MSVPTAISETSSQIIPLKGRIDLWESSRISGHRDYSRLSCDAGDTQLGPRTKISARIPARTLVNRPLPVSAGAERSRIFFLAHSGVRIRRPRHIEQPSRDVRKPPRSAKVGRNPCRSCIFTTPQLKREKSPLRSFGQLTESHGGLSNGFLS